MFARPPHLQSRIEFSFALPSTGSKLQFIKLTILLSANHESINSYIGVSLILTGFVGGLSVSTAYPIVAAEVPSARLRARTLGIGFFINALVSWVFNFCVPYIYNVDAGNLGGKTGFVFFGTCLVGLVLSWFEIP